MMLSRVYCVGALVSLPVAKLFSAFPEGGHNDTCDSPGYFGKVREFISDLVLSPDADQSAGAASVGL